jgi:hypothetical protein
MSGTFLPGAVWRPITYRADAGPFIAVPLGWVLHVVVGNGSPFPTFQNAKSPDRRFSTGWVAKDGHAEQYTTTDMKPWAQGAGNDQYLAFETEGYPTEPLTAAQIETLAIWHNFLHTPDQLAEMPGQRGIGTHYMGKIAWGGHTCPDPVAGAGPRSKQRTAIIARARQLRTPTSLPASHPATLDPFQEDPMDRLVIACYRKLIGRTPADSEVDGWLVQAAQNGWTGKDVATRISASAEAKAHAALPVKK